MFYRIKQFCIALVSKPSKDDIEFVNEYLDSNEKELFNKLSKSEQKHCINVSREMKQAFDKDINLNKIIKISLLHDIGKIEKRLTPIDKGILVILNKITKGSLKKYCKNAKVYVYYNHGKVGSTLLKGIEYDKDYLQIIEYHHEPNANVKYINILNKLQEIDDRY